MHVYTRYDKKYIICNVIKETLNNYASIIMITKIHLIIILYTTLTLPRAYIA